MTGTIEQRPPAYSAIKVGGRGQWRVEKAEIEAYGVEPFIHKCQESVWRYMKEWETLTERIGFWIDLSDAYVTYRRAYVESVWWSLKGLHQRGMLVEFPLPDGSEQPRDAKVTTVSWIIPRT
mgnify:CR=1 FL=1